VSTCEFDALLHSFPVEVLRIKSTLLFTSYQAEVLSLEELCTSTTKRHVTPEILMSFHVETSHSDWCILLYVKLSETNIK